jgi:nucleotide-binding universal stress UspA family protein
MGIGRIVVGLDASQAAGRALTWAVELARALGAEVIAVHAVDLPPPVPRSRNRRNSVREGREQLRGIWREERQEAFEVWCAPLWESRIRYRTFLREGRPAATLIRVAETEGADLIVVGSRNRRTIAGLLLGSVGRDLTRDSTRPVVIIPTERAEKPPLDALQAEA